MESKSLKQHWTQVSSMEKVIFCLLCLANIAFLVYWIVLSCNYRMHYDDVHFTWNMRDMSIYAYVKDAYLGLSGRIAGYTLNGILFTLVNWFGYNWLPIANYILGIAITWGVVRDAFPSISRPMLFATIVLIFNVYVLTAIDFAVFTWICAMCYYLYGAMLCLFIKYLNYSKMTWWRWSILAIMTFFIGLGNEAFTPILLVVMLFNGLYLWRTYRWRIKDAWQDYRIRRIVYMAIILLVLFAIVVAAPGNYARLNGDMEAEGFNLPTGVGAFCKNLIKHIVMLFYFMAFYIPYLCVPLFMAYYLGTQSQYPFIVPKRKVIGGIILAVVLYVFVASLPMTFLYGHNFGAQRNYTNSCFFITLSFAAIGYVLGLGNAHHKTLSAWVVTIGLVGMIVIVGLNYHQDIPVAKAYAKAHDERKVYLLKLQENGQTETVIVSPYPRTATPDVKYNVYKWLGKSTSMPAIYYEADTGTEPNEYESHVKKLLNLDFDFVLAE